MNLSASNDVSMIFQRYVEEPKVSLFKDFVSLDLLTQQNPQILFIFTKLRQIYHSKRKLKKIPSWKENNGEFTYVLRHLTK